MKFDWWTFGLQALNFLVLVWLLQRFLYRPVMAVVKRRREEAQRTLSEAAKVEEQAAEASRAYEEKIAELDRTREQVLDDARRKAADERLKLLVSARDEADKILDTAYEKTETERREALVGLRRDAADMAVGLAKVLLSETAPGVGASAFLERITAHLKGLPQNELDALRRQLDGVHMLHVVTAQPLEKSEQAVWHRRLSEFLSPESDIEFSNDDGLIAGAELHFPHSVLRFNWRDTLNDLRKELHQHADAD